MFNVHTAFNLLNCSIDWQNEKFILHCYQFSVLPSPLLPNEKNRFSCPAYWNDFQLEIRFNFNHSLSFHFASHTKPKRTVSTISIHISIVWTAFCHFVPHSRSDHFYYLLVCAKCMVTVQWTRMCVYVAMNDKRAKYCKKKKKEGKKKTPQNQSQWVRAPVLVPVPEPEPEWKIRTQSGYSIELYLVWFCFYRFPTSSSSSSLSLSSSFTSFHVFFSPFESIPSDGRFVRSINEQNVQE